MWSKRSGESGNEFTGIQGAWGVVLLMYHIPVLVINVLQWLSVHKQLCVHILRVGLCLLKDIYFSISAFVFLFVASNIYGPWDEATIQT